MIGSSDRIYTDYSVVDGMARKVIDSPMIVVICLDKLLQSPIGFDALSTFLHIASMFSREPRSPSSFETSSSTSN